MHFMHIIFFSTILSIQNRAFQSNPTIISRQLGSAASVSCSKKQTTGSFALHDHHRSKKSNKFDMYHVFWMIIPPLHFQIRTLGYPIYLKILAYNRKMYCTTNFNRLFIRSHKSMNKTFSSQSYYFV